LRRPEAEEGAASSRRLEVPEEQALQYLRRYGVVMRDLLSREAGAPPWRELLPIYRRLEARGTLRGGRFVAGFTGEQFALPEAVEALRAARRAPSEGERVELSAADPLNLVGILTPGQRVPATLGNRVAFVDGVPETASSAPARVRTL
jgi:ATP-dependent Lhr-like helicase